jgi:hypothetical protein
MGDEDVKLKSVRLHISGMEIDVTIEDAKELQRQLNATFGRDHWYPIYPIYPQPSYPYWSVTTSGAAVSISSGGTS